MRSNTIQRFLYVFLINVLLIQSINTKNNDSVATAEKTKIATHKVNNTTKESQTNNENAVKTNEKNVPNDMEIELANLIYLIYCDPIVMKYLEEFMSPRADINVINNTLRALIINILTQADKFGLSPRNNELKKAIALSINPLNNHFEVQLRGIIDAASAMQTLKDYYFSKFYSPYTLNYFVTQMMFMPNKFFKNNYFKKIVRARNEITRVLMTDEQTLAKIKKLLEEIKVINADMTHYHMSYFHTQYDRYKEENIIKETNTQTYLTDFWKESLEGVFMTQFFKQAFLFGIAQGFREEFGAKNIFKSIVSGLANTAEGFINKQTFNILPLLGYDKFLTSSYNDYMNEAVAFAQGTSDGKGDTKGKQPVMKPAKAAKMFAQAHLDLERYNKMSDAEKKDVDKRLNQGKLLEMNLLGIAQEEEIKNLKPEEKDYYSKQKSIEKAYKDKRKAIEKSLSPEEQNDFNILKMKSVEAMMIENPLLALEAKSYSKQTGKLQDLVAPIVTTAEQERRLGEIYNKSGPEKQKKDYALAALQITQSSSSLWKTFKHDIPAFAKSLWNMTANYISKDQTLTPWDKDKQSIKFFYLCPIFETGIKVFEAVSMVQQAVKNSEIIDAYKNYTNCLTRKIKCVTELMVLYQKLLNAKLDIQLPEFTHLKKLLTNKQNQEKIKELKIAADRNKIAWMAINQVIPVFILQQYQDLIVNYFELNNDQNFVKEYGSADAMSLFFKVVENFISFFDIVVTNIAILKQSRGEFSMPEFVDYNGSSESLVFDIQDMFVPGSQFKSNNSITLGGSKEQRNIMITAPIGSGKTFIIKNMLLVLYLANVGIVPAKKALLTLFGDCCQSNSILYTEKRGGISKNMGERMFVDTTIKKVSEVLDAYFVLLDEFFGGTQVEQALKLAEAKVVPLWKKENVIGVYTTHFGPMIDLIKKHTDIIMKGYIGVIELPDGSFKKTYTLKANKDYKDPSDWWFNTDSESIARKNRYGEWSGKQEEKIMQSMLAGGSNYR